MYRKFTATTILLTFAFATFGQLDLSGLNPLQQKIKEPVELKISRDTTSPPDTLVLALTFKMDKNVHLYAAESLFFKCSVDTMDGTGDAIIDLPEPHPFTNFDKTSVGVYTDGQQIRLQFPLKKNSWSVKGTVGFQACDTTMCFTPRTIYFTANSKGTLTTGTDDSPQDMQTSIGTNTTGDIVGRLDDFTILGSRGGYMNPEAFSGFLADPSGTAGGKNGGFEGKGFFVIVLFILLGGIALNLTPCVLPMIPITIAVIGAGAQAKSRARGMLTGGIYGLAMALTYGILGLVVVLTGTRFGVINASPLFNIMIAAVFILMALAMFDIIQIDFTRFRKSGGSQGERGKLVTVFFMGIIASLLAGACVAPVVISVVLYAGTLYSQGNPAGLLLPFLLGAGMALPWPFAGAGLSFLPKPGKWMVWVKYVFGVFILAMALYYGYTGIHLFRQNTPPAAAEKSGTESGVPWLISLEDGLRKATEENKPLFIDFWATWCKNCKAMDATTFRDPGVEKLLSGYVLVKYQAEHPDEPETKALLNRFGVVGLPTYVVLKAK
ncbi:MAG: thioredoxin family protein [Chitinispirillaceae bacterium]|nr:thioredoxin family protein [Chitinispirillaceae bacterium]